MEPRPLGRVTRPRVIYNTPRLGAHGGANGVVPLLPARPCELDTTIRIALGERHAQKCAMTGEKLYREVSGLCMTCVSVINFKNTSTQNKHERTTYNQL